MKRTPFPWLGFVRVAAATGVALVQACATAAPTPEPTPEPAVAASSAAPSGVAPEGTPPPAAAQTATSPPPADPAAPAAAADAPAAPRRDKIDDENWLPESGPARDAFAAAVDVARTDPVGAAARFTDAAGKTSYFYAAWFNAGVAAEAAGDLPGAEKNYRQALAVRADHGPTLANLALLLKRTGRTADADALVRGALASGADKAGPHLAAATLAWANGDAAAAEREAYATLKYDERSVPAMQVMARVFKGQGRLDTARFALENARDVEPGNALVHYDLGQVLRAQNEDKLAIIEFEKAARLRPDFADAQANYGILLLQQGYPLDAVRVFEAAVRLEPRSGRAQLHLGNGLRATKQYPQAEAAYKKALELDAALHDARFNLGILYIDNPLPGLEELARLQQAVVQLQDYKAKASPTGAVLARVDDYLDATNKRIQKEIKRRERDERRKRDEEKEKAKAPPPDAAPAPAADAAPAPAPAAAPTTAPAAEPATPAAGGTP